MILRIRATDCRVYHLEGDLLMVVIETTADEIETAIKDQPGTLTDRCKRLAEMVRETQTPETYAPTYIPEPIDGPIKLRPGWPVLETARKMFGGDQ